MIDGIAYHGFTDPIQKGRHDIRSRVRQADHMASLRNIGSIDHDLTDFRLYREISNNTHWEILHSVKEPLLSTQSHVNEIFLHFSHLTKDIWNPYLDRIHQCLADGRSFDDTRTSPHGQLCIIVSLYWNTGDRSLETNKVARKRDRVSASSDRTVPKSNATVVEGGLGNTAMSVPYH